MKFHTSRKTRSVARSRCSLTRRLWLEALEDRLAPATLTVNSLHDNTTDTTVLTLRDAITLVNNGGAPASLGQSSMPAGWQSQIDTTTNSFGTSDTITFTPNLANQNIDLNTQEGGQGTLTINQSVTIQAPSTGIVFIIGGQGDGSTINGQFFPNTTNAQPLVISSGAQVSLVGMQISNGYTTYGNGGGIANFGTLTLDGTAIQNNYAGGDGGGVFNLGTLIVKDNSDILQNRAAGHGGGIYNGSPSNDVLAPPIPVAATLRISASTVQLNVSGEDGGGVFNSDLATLTTDTGSVIYGNTAVNWTGGVFSNWGGGIFNIGSINISQTRIANNAAASGGGIFNWIGASPDVPIFQGQAAISDCTIEVNQTASSGVGGGIFTNGSMTISGDPTTFYGCKVDNNSAAYGAGLFYSSENSASSLAVSNCEIGGNSAGNSGGGAYLGGNSGPGPQPTITGTLFSENSAFYSGGGLYGVGATVSTSTFYANTANNGGGAYATFSTITGSSFQSNSASSDGGGGYITGTSTISNCTLTGNWTDYGNGGGIFSNGTSNVTGTTLSGNTAGRYGFYLGGNGGGIYSNGTLTITNTSVSGNQAARGGGGIYLYNGSANSIVSGCTLQNNSGRDGGGILTKLGTLTVDDSTFLQNDSYNAGGGIANISGALTVNRSAFSSNLAFGYVGPPYSAGGAGIYNDAFGTTSITDCTFSGGALLGNFVLRGTGGGLVNHGTMTVTDSVISGNFDDAIVNTVGGTLTLGGSTLNGNSGIEAGAIGNGGTMTVTNCTLSDNRSEKLGGAIQNGGSMMISGCTLSGNTSFAGGAITNGRSLMVSASTFSGNSASDEGGAIFNLPAGSLTLSGCTISSNTAGNSGGGIFNESQFGGYAALTIENNTAVFNNQAPTGADIENFGIVAASDSTISALDNQNPNAGAVTFNASSTTIAQANANTIAQMAAPIINGAPVPVTITLNLAQGTYQDLTLGTQANVTLVVNGVNGSVGTVNGTTVVGNSPALVVMGGNVLIQNIDFTTATDAPTILITGGNLTLRNDIVQESTGYNDAAIQVTGGSIDLGTAASPGGNTININGAGQFVVNTGPNPVTAGGDTFETNGSAVYPVSTMTLSSSVNPSLPNQPITLSASVSAATAGAGTPTGNVTFVDTTSGTTLGTATLSGGIAQLTISTLGLGTRNILAVYVGDTNFITSYATLVQTVHYQFSGFLAPLNSNLAFALGRTVPIKFQLSSYTGFVSTLSAVTSLQVLDGSGNNVLTNPGSTALRYDSTSNQFVANWQTKGLSAGTYKVVLSLADGTTYTKTVQLSKTGSAAGLMVDGSVTTTATGALLGGDIELYVDNSNGDLTTDELARIQDAVTAADAVTEPYGVAVQEVTDPTLADVTLNMDTTSAVGGYADGVLGCTTDAGQITVIQGWNFYAGSDATQIGSAQYDFETVVTHELGHALGLGHSSDSTSVMYATLNTGTVNRNLTTADLNVPDSDTTGACGLHAAPIQPDTAAVVTAPAAPLSNPNRDLLFAMLGTEPDSLPLGSRQRLGRSSEPSRTSFDISTPSGNSRQPIFAGSSAKEDDYLLLEMPLFPDPSQDRQDDGSNAAGASSDAADGFADFLAASSDLREY